jgi:tRNA (mo5U34)-methyltransferase
VSVRGAIDRCTERTLAGWIRNDADPDRPIRMQICADGRAIPELIVSGDGHAFTYAAPNGVDLTRQRLSLAFPDGEIEPIEIEAWRCPIVIPAVPPAVLQQQASRQLGRMFHSIDLGGGHWTDGLKSPDRMRFEAQAWEFPADLRGKSVLDIGCADGGWSVEAYRRGARQVLSIDERTTGAMRFFLDNRVFPFDFRQIDLFSTEFIELPVFDVVIFAGVLYHVQHPLEALKRVRSKTGELAILETHVDDSLGADVPHMIFYETNEAIADDPTNWWGPNTACLEAMLRTAGFHAKKVFEEGSGGFKRLCYHLVPDRGAVYSAVLASATGADAVLEEYRQTADRLRHRVAELEALLAHDKPAD